MNKLTEVQKQKIKEIVGKIYRDGIAENMTRQDIRINELYELFSTLLQKEREAIWQEAQKEINKYFLDPLFPQAKIAVTEVLLKVLKPTKEDTMSDDFKFDKKGNSIP